MEGDKTYAAMQASVKTNLKFVSMENGPLIQDLGRLAMTRLRSVSRTNPTTTVSERVPRDWKDP